jgi:hypothetical protein
LSESLDCCAYSERGLSRCTDVGQQNVKLTLAFKTPA